MIYILNKKSLVCGLIILFIGASFTINAEGAFKDFNNKTSNRLSVIDERDIIIVPDNYSTIQDAIDNASDYDIIRVYAGIYYENLEVYKPLTIQGNGTQNTTIDGRQLTNVVNITISPVTFKDFNICNSSEKIDDIGFGISIYGANYSTDISNNLFSNNDCDLNLMFCNGLKEDVIVSNNIFSKGRGNNFGIWGLYQSYNIDVLNNTFNDKNIGLYVLLSSNCTIRGNIFENCGKASIYLYESAFIKISFNKINNTDQFGLWFVEGSNTNYINHNSFLKNDDAIVLEGSQKNVIMFNNIEGSYSGFELTCKFSPFNYAGFNWWGDRRGPRGKVVGIPVLFCRPVLRAVWQEAWLHEQFCHDTHTL